MLRSAGALFILIMITFNASGQVSLSEIRVDQPGPDTDEYFELAGPPGWNLADQTYLVIGDGTGGSGVVEMALSLSGLTIPENGFGLVAESGFSLGPTPDLVATLNFENSDNVTHLIVTGFNGSVGEDLDIDDDGFLDYQPWTGEVDCLAILDSADGGDLTYCATSIGPDGGSSPAHVYRDGGWRMGPDDPVSGVDTPGEPPVALPIEIESFEVISNSDRIVLRWTATGHFDIVEFRIRRLDDRERSIVARVAVRPDNKGAGEYRVALDDSPAGRYQLELVGMHADGTESILGRSETTVHVNKRLDVSRPFPNPTSGRTAFHVSVDRDSELDVAIYDIRGGAVRKVFRGTVPKVSGRYFDLDLSALPAGIVFVVVRGRDRLITRPVVIH